VPLLYPFLSGMRPVRRRTHRHQTTPVCDRLKFKAVNSRRKNFSKRKLKSFIKKIDQQIEDYLNDLDQNDELEAQVHKPSAEEIQQKIKSLKERKGTLGKLLDELEASSETQVSFTDPDSRSMPLGQNHGTQVGYNVQVSVDDMHKLIVDHDVTNEVNDFDQLDRMASRAKEILQVDELMYLPTKVTTTALRSKPACRRALRLRSPKRIPPPIERGDCLPSRISGMTKKMIATGVQLARS